MAYKNKEDRAAYMRAYRKGKVHKAYYASIRDERIVYQREWYYDNKEQNCADAKAWREANPERHAANARNWSANNRGKRAATTAKYNAAKLQRTPAWADHLVISMIYEDCPEGMQVDHIYPLQGETVSGLHTVWNLQYLTPSENQSKGNRV